MSGEGIHDDDPPLVPLPLVVVAPEEACLFLKVPISFVCVRHDDRYVCYDICQPGRQASLRYEWQIRTSIRELRTWYARHLSKFMFSFCPNIKLGPPEISTPDLNVTHTLSLSHTYTPNTFHSISSMIEFKVFTMSTSIYDMRICHHTMTSSCVLSFMSS